MTIWHIKCIAALCDHICLREELFPMRFLVKSVPILILLTISIACSSVANADHSRRWADRSGKFTVDAELLISDKDLVVLEREDGDVIAVRRDQLSKTDQEFLSKHDANSVSALRSDTDSQWKLSHGQVIAGRLMGFGQQDLIVKRERGEIWVNDRRLEELPSAYRKILPNVVAAIDRKPIHSLEELEAHLIELGAGPFKYTVEGVQLDLKDWGAVTVPLPLLAIDEAKEIQPGYDRWKASRENTVSDDERYKIESRERLALQSRDRLRARVNPRNRRQMRLMELSLIAADTGVTDIWEVVINPPNRYGYQQSVIVSAPNSLDARRQVAQKYPNWKIGAIAKRND